MTGTSVAASRSKQMRVVFFMPISWYIKSTSLGETDLRPPYNLETKLTGFGFHASIHSS